MTKNWYDEGIGSEKLKRDIAQSALNNPVTPGPCICCDKIKKLQAKNRRLQAKLVKAKEKIEKWSVHNQECMIARFSALGCRCGLYEENRS